MTFELWIGLDGTDSRDGGCTTWTMSRFIDDLRSNDKSLNFLDYPYLIRLNPNVPQKTRGNGALAIHIETSLTPEMIANLLRSRIAADQSHYDLDEGKIPAFVISDRQPPTEIYLKALQLILTPQECLSLFTPLIYWPEESQSIVGAMAAISVSFSDFTFELLSYRYLDQCGSPRVIDSNEVLQLSKKYVSTFSSYDTRENRILITPAGPDPVFCGIRGDIPSDLQAFFSELTIDEPIESWTIFKTNQATNEYLRSPQVALEPNSVFCGVVHLVESPKVYTGGHVTAKGRYQETILSLIWFEPTKILRDVARELRAGDILQITAAVNLDEDLSLQVESMLIVSCPPTVRTRSPICSCGSRMKSAGSFKGYKCKSCGKTSDFPVYVLEERSVFSGQLVHPTRGAQRHLLRPLDRLHIRNKSGSSKDDIALFRKLI